MAMARGIEEDRGYTKKIVRKRRAGKGCSRSGGDRSGLYSISLKEEKDGEDREI